MRALLTLLFALELSACGALRRGEAPVADADPQCHIKCTPSLTDTGVRWIVNPEDPASWDALGAGEDGVTRQLAEKLLQCERRRQACEGFIQDLRKHGGLR